MVASTPISSRRTTAAVASRNFLRPSSSSVRIVVAVVEVIELLRQLERVLGGVGGLGGAMHCSIIDDVLAAASQNSQISFPLSPAKKRAKSTVETVANACSGLNSGLAEDVGGPHHGVLRVGAGFALEANASLKSKAITDYLVNFSMK